jgi:predicted nucleotidyltransferase
MIYEEEIAHFGEVIAQRFSPEKIILFGSHAYGQPTKDSDVDILVIMPHSGTARDAALEVKNALPRPFPLDLIVRSHEELDGRLKKNDFFFREILHRGKILYERRNQRVD